MESLREFAHINLEWHKDPFKKRTWNLQFDDDVICIVTLGGWLFRKTNYAQSSTGKWLIKLKGKDPCLIEIRDRTVIGKKLFDVGFKKKFSLGMLNTSVADTFNWKKLEGTKGYAWYQDGLEVVRFERVSRGGRSKKGFVTSIVNNRLEESWLTAMIVTGFLAMR